MAQVFNGIDVLAEAEKYQNYIRGTVGYLCHQASVTKDLTLGIFVMKELFGSRLTKLFGPQHGFASDVQDNMVETQDYVHPYFKLPVHSLYSHTRVATQEMLDGIDTLVVDLQDVGTRVYTYISTLYLLMQECGRRDIRVVVLDRVNPVGGAVVEGAMLQDAFRSFVGMMPLPQRHGLTMGEIARFAQRHCKLDCECMVVPLYGWKRTMFFQHTYLPWVMPSPNLGVAEACIPYVGTVLFEGTTLSEGRGTVRSLELIGHPKLEPYAFCKKMNHTLYELEFEGIFLRPTTFLPTFNKHSGIVCGGFQVHVTHAYKARPWQVVQLACKELFHTLQLHEFWHTQPFEYEHERLAIDILNGTDALRQWVERDGSFEALQAIENVGRDEYMNRRSDILMYHKVYAAMV